MSAHSSGPPTRNLTPVLSPTPQRFGLRTQRVIDNVEEMLGMLEDRMQDRLDGEPVSPIKEFPPPILASASPTYRRPLSTGSRDSYATPPSRPAYSRSPSSVSSASSSRNHEPLHRSPLKQGFSAPEPVRSKSTPPREQQNEFPPPILATSRSGSAASSSSVLSQPGYSSTSSEAGRDLLATLDSMQLSPQPITTPKPPSTPRQPIPPSTETTPTPRAPHTRTTFSRAWLDPVGAEQEDIFVPERVTGMGMVRKREMTPVEERTERGSSLVRDDEARVLGWSGKPLPSTPSGSAPSLPASPTKKRATTDLIKFFEHASSPSVEKTKPGHTRGTSDHLPIRNEVPYTRGHARAISVPEEPFQFVEEPPAFERVASDIDTLIHPHDSASEVAFQPAPIAATHPTPVPVTIAVPIAKKRDTSPLRNVRNVVAAWRGNLPTPHPVAFDTPALRLGTADGDEKGKRGNVFEEAFFTIRRMSTRRRKRVEEKGKNGEVGREEKPLPLLVGEPEQREVAGRMEAVQGNLVSTMTEMTSEPIRVGEIWYLNVHDPSTPFKWIKCDAQLFADRLVLTWIPEFAASGSRGIITLDLVHCLEVRSIPSPNHPSATTDVGSIAAKAVPGLSDNLYPFQLVYDDGVERLGSESARDRVRWVSAIWDILENTPDDGQLDDDAPASSENGSRSTILHRSPGLSDTHEGPTSRAFPRAEARYSRTSDDIHIGDSQTGVLPLKRSSSKHLGRSQGSLLRRVASEADLDLVAMAAPIYLAKQLSPPASMSSTVSKAPSGISIASRPRMTPTSRLQASSVSSAQYESAFALPTLDEHVPRALSPESIDETPFRTVASDSIPGSFSTKSSRSSDRLPSYSSAVTVLPVRELEPATLFGSALSSTDMFAPFATPATPPRLPTRRDDQLAGTVTPFQSASSFIAGTEYNTATAHSSRSATPKGSVVSKSIIHLATPVDPREKQSALSAVTDYFTATEGSGTYYTPQSGPPSRFRSLTESSVSHAASSLDRTTASTVSSHKSTASTAKTSSRIPLPSFPSSSSSSSTSRTPSSSTSSSTPRPVASSTSNALSSVSLPRRILDAVLDNEKARVDDTTMVVSQLDRIELAVADIGTFLSIPPALSAKDGEIKSGSYRQEAAPSSPGSPSSPSSSSSSSDTATRPGTPVEDSRLFKDLAAIKDQNRELMDQQLQVRQMLESGEAKPTEGPSLERLEDLLLRLLARTEDSDSVTGFSEQEYISSRRARKPSSPSIRSRATFDTAHQDSMYSDEQGVRAPAPAPSIDSDYARRQSARRSGVPESLLEMSSHLTEGLDEEWEMQNLPPPSPDVDLDPRPRAMPPIVLNRMNPERYASSASEAGSPSPRLHHAADDEVSSEADTLRPVQRPIIIPRRQSPESSSETTTTSTTPSPRRRHFRPGPVPQPVRLPSPVPLEGYPSVVPPPSFRPGFPYPRPSRLAGAREPMTTTYFRRGFPPPMPMGPMAGPHMGPYMTGMRPGMPGFGGPFGPNVFPRPGYMPPGAAGGDYGIPRRPFFPPRPPRGGSPGRSSTRGYTDSHYSYSDPGSHQTEQELQEAVNHLDQVHHEAIDKAEALAEAQGQQSNEIGRYLHQLGSVMDQNRADQMRELMTLHEDIGRIRDQLNHPPPPLPPKTPIVPAQPPQSPAVQVTVNTAPSEKAKPVPSPQPMPAAVMNITEHSQTGESPVLATLPIPTDKDRQQDALLRDLQDKVTELARRLAEREMHQQQPIEKIVIKETEYDPQELSNAFVKPLPPQPVIALGPPISVPAPQSDPSAIPAPASIGGPAHVHFGPEHVKETTTEVIRGPAGQDIEREIVREYDRTPSEVAAGLPPSHETVVETKTVQRPASVMFGDPAAGSVPGTFRDPAGTAMHDTVSGTHPHKTTIIEEDFGLPGTRYPVSHPPPSTAPPSVIHVQNVPPMPPTSFADGHRQTVPPTVLGESDLHNRPTVVVEEHPEGLLVRPVPSKKQQPSIVREQPVQLGNMPTHTSQPPVLHELPVPTIHADQPMVAADHPVPMSGPGSVSFAHPIGTSYPGGSSVHDAGTHRSHSPDDMHHASSNKSTNNKLRKPVPAAKVQEAPNTSHANVAPGTQSDYPQDRSVPMDNMSNIAHEQAPGHAAHSHKAPSEIMPPAMTAGDQSSQKAKPMRDRPAQGAGKHAPVTLSTPPYLGQDSSEPTDHYKLANIPGAYEQHTGTAGPHSVGRTQEDVHGKSPGERPNVLKKKHSQPASSGTHGLPSQTSADHLDSAEDHGAKVNISISNDDGGGKATPHDGAPGHHSDANAHGRPHSPSLRKGHPAVSHSDPSRPETLHMPIQDGLGGSRFADSAVAPGKKSQDKHTKSPEDVMAENERLAAQSKAKAAQADVERLERDTIQRRKEEKEKLAAHRHQEHLDALADLKKVISDHHGKDDKWETSYSDSAKDKEKRRTEKTTKEKQWQSAFDKLLSDVESDKKWREAESKKPGADAVIDFLKKSNEDQTAFLRALAADIMTQNADQHKSTKEAAKSMAREQVAFNVAGYLDDFSKTLSGEVRALLKEVGDLRETRRALYYELAELLLLKGRQSAGDLMAVMPWPGPGNAAGPARPIPPPPGAAKPAPPKPAAAKQEAKPAPVPPAWQSFNIPPTMNLGGPPIASTTVPTARPMPPATGSRPLPVPGNADGK